LIMTLRWLQQNARAFIELLDVNCIEG